MPPSSPIGTARSRRPCATLSSSSRLRAARAILARRQLDLRYATVSAPIAGRIDQALVTEGALVSAGSTQMATIRQTDVLYVNIQQSSTDLLRLRQQLLAGDRVRNDGVEVSILLEDGSEYEHKGRLLFIDSSVEESTGQVMVRAAVPTAPQAVAA